VITEPLGISVDDHVIVDNESHASFKGLKLI
jgi:DNA repair protein RadC